MARRKLRKRLLEKAFISGIADAEDGSNKKFQKVAIIVGTVIVLGFYGYDSYDSIDEAREDYEEVKNKGYFKKHLRSALGENIDAAIKAKDLKELARTLYYIGDSEPYIKADELLALLVDKDSEVVTMLNGIGGHYDKKIEPKVKETEGEAADQKEAKVTYESGGVNCYGDFYFQPSSTRKTKGKYDTSGLNAGIWNSLTAGQKAEISSGSSKTATIPAVNEFRGEIISVDLEDIIKQGYDFAYHNADGSFVFVSENSIITTAYELAASKGHYPIKGDFSKILAEIEKEYTEAKQAKAETADAADTTAAEN